ncbi:putative secreted protein [Streptomyces scabiei 87.22]|uniref:Putative secreted protein n=2 Tax=Streptomyces TaxID=1883 RepID=C9Z2L5_STRSW|nr:putative secreted protein [Streptomyces scabiei 87.22]
MVTATVACMAFSVSMAQAVDLRVQPVDDVLERVERSLQVHLLPETLVRKRRSVGARTDRDTWVRIERRLLDKIPDQGWNGTECAARLEGITQPEWHGCVVWRDVNGPMMWRADETALLPGAPVGTAVLSVAPELPDQWWESLNASLDALAAQATRRIATPDTATITQALVTESIHGVFPSDFDTTVERWVPAHADLNWANVTAPTFSLFDWEDWGNAPLGLDSSSLWASSLAVPALADRVRHERRSDFESRDGKLMALFSCSKILGPYAHPEDPRLEPARRTADQIIKELQAG